MSRSWNVKKIFITPSSVDTVRPEGELPQTFDPRSNIRQKWNSHVLDERRNLTVEWNNEVDCFVHVPYDEVNQEFISDGRVDKIFSLYSITQRYIFPNVFFIFNHYRDRAPGIVLLFHFVIVDVKIKDGESHLLPWTDFDFPGTPRCSVTRLFCDHRWEVPHLRVNRNVLIIAASLWCSHRGWNWNWIILINLPSLFSSPCGIVFSASVKLCWKDEGQQKLG